MSNTTLYNIKLGQIKEPEINLEKPIESEKSNFRYSEIDIISQKSSIENLDTKKFFKHKNLKIWKQNQERREEIFLNTSIGFQRVDDFKGKYL